MPSTTDDSECIGKFIIHEGRLIKSKNAKIVPENAKHHFLNILATTSVKKQFSNHSKKEVKEDEVQTEEAADKTKGTPNTTLLNENIWRAETKASAAQRSAIKAFSAKNRKLLVSDPIVTDKAANAMNTVVRLFLRMIIEQSKKVSHHGNHKRLVPNDIDIALGLLKIEPDIICPAMKSTPYTDRMFWGRKMTAPPPKTVSANSTDLVSHEKFCDSIVIKDHWLVVEGVQPCIPENVVPADVRLRTQQQIEETQRLVGFGMSGIKKDNFEKRTSKQTFSLEHQVLFNEVVNILTNGTPLERQKALQCIETDHGLQFLAGRFVILIAEGVRVNIGNKNIRALSNLVKLSWSLMKNPKIRLDQYLYVLLPSLVSCIITKSIVPILERGISSNKSRLSTSGDSLSSEDEERIIRDLDIEFRVRETSSRVLNLLCEQYSSQCLNVRVIQAIRKVLTGTYDPATVYGVLCTFFAFGYLTIKTVVIPRLHDIYCGLASFCGEDAVSRKTTGSKMKKIVMEAELKRIELARNRVIELVMKILYEYEACEPEQRMVEEQVFVKLYAEFGSMFYRYLIETEKIDDDGRVLVTRPSLLKNSIDGIDSNKEKPAVKKPVGNYTGPLKMHEIDEDMLLENILDDDRPWKDVAKKLEEKTVEGDQKLKAVSTKETFFGNPKLLLIRKTQSSSTSASSSMSSRRNTPSISYIRPLELAHMPNFPTFRHTKRSDKMGSIAARSAISVDDVALAHSVLKEPAELLKKYLTRPETQAAAVVYGRSMEFSEKGRSMLDHQISDAATLLSTVRLSNAVANFRGIGSGGPLNSKEDANRGKFLAPSSERGTRL